MENLKKEAEWIFDEIDKKEIWEKSTEDCFKRVDNDLYFYDPQQETGVILGDMGVGWICLYEDYFMEI